MKVPQTQRVLTYMEEHGSISPLEAIRDIGCLRLASRISDLRRQGVKIESETVTVMNRFGDKTYIKRYRLGGENNVSI